ncbi:MAG: hypothetical protein A2Z49_08465 [Chloroflexi bacterium RBG_19FT_COMBO_56_12]|nr:MAG: hypothetical protein A2Z49_08465 [Chloroflexi bacterium RBG_19FT_COMBO_56_12]
MSSEPKTTLVLIKAASIYLLKIAILAVVYHLAARLGLEMAYVQVNTSPVWPPTGIALAALLIFGFDIWPGISLGVLLGSLFTGAPFNLAIGMTLGNTLEAIVGAYCLRRFVSFHIAIDRIQDVVGLVFIGIISTTIGASLGTMTLMLTGNGVWQDFGAIWVTWWIGDLLGALVIMPMLLVWVTIPSFRANKRRYLEGGILLYILAVVTWYVFSNQPPVGTLHQALIYVIFPFMIWAALRFHQHGAATATFLVSGIAIWGTSQGMGPFSLESKNDSLVLLQTFMGVVSVTSLILAAATIERRRTAEALRQRVDDLITLNDSSKTFLDNTDIASTYHTISQIAVTRLGVDVAWIEETGRNGAEVKPGAIYGIPVEAIARLITSWEGGISFLQQETALVKTADDLDPSTGSTNLVYQSYAAFPLVFSNQSIGTLKLLSKNKFFFTEDRKLLAQSYANLAAVAIQNTRLFEEVRKGNQQLHALSQRLMKAQEEERLHLSRELHDESGQLLAALMVQLGLLERDANHSEAVHELIAELKGTTNEIQDNLHQLAVNLRPASLDHLGLVTAVQQYVDEFSQQYGIQVEFEAIGMEGKRLHIQTETALFRVIQESLTNIVLHAQATHVDVLINLQNCQVITIVEDNGVGFLPTSPNFDDHLGLFGMRERIEMLGGNFTIESSPGKGTLVRTEVPYDD